MAINTRFHTTTIARPAITAPTAGKRTNIRLWTTQAAIGALFIFAGGAKLAMSPADLTADSPFAAWFMYFIGAAEVLGGIGVILPWALRIKPALTPLAAAGLAIIMVGAAVTVAFTMAPALASINIIIAAAAISIVTGRRDFASRAR